MLLSDDFVLKWGAFCEGSGLVRVIIAAKCLSSCKPFLKFEIDPKDAQFGLLKHLGIVKDQNPLDRFDPFLEAKVGRWRASRESLQNGLG